VTATPLHPRSWLAWLAAVLLALSLTRTPLLLGLIVVCLAVLSHTLGDEAQPAPLPLPWLRMAALILGFSALFNALTAHFGRTVLFTLPASLPLLGGNVTLEAAVYGLLNGLVLLGFLLVFRLLYQALPVQALIGLLPRGLYPVAVVLSIALSFVPASLMQWQQIRAAQALRGHRVRGLRDALPLLLPLLVGGLERALQLAEAMTARGFGSLGANKQAQPDRLRLGMVLGLLLLLGGLLAMLFWQQATLGWAATVLGGVLLWVMLWLQGRRVQRTVYRRHRWSRADSLLLAAAVLLAGVMVFAARRGWLAYSPYPALSWPTLKLWLPTVLLPLLLAPRLVRPGSMRRGQFQRVK